MLRFRVFGIPFQVAPYFWVGAALIGGIGGSAEDHAILRLMIWVACVFVSIVVHELGHAALGRAFGCSPYVILQGLGGVTYLPGARLTRGRSILVSLAGPAAGFALWAVNWLIVSRMEGPLDFTDPVLLSVGMATIYLGFINSVWTIFNLLPFLPLDGGQVLRTALGPKWIGVTRSIGGLVAACGAGLALHERQIYLAFFLGYLSYVNFKGDPSSIPGGTAR